MTIRRTPLLLTLSLSLLFYVGCATTSPADTQVKYRPEVGEEIPSGSLPRQPLVEAVNNEVRLTIAQEGGENGYLSRGELQQAKRYSPAHFFSEVTLAPVKEGGKFLGYRIEQISPYAETIAQRFTERPHVNDIIVSINQVRQKTPDDFIKVWNGMDQEKAITFELLRGDSSGVAGGTPFVVTWPIR